MKSLGSAQQTSTAMGDTHAQDPAFKKTPKSKRAQKNASGPSLRQRMLSAAARSAARRRDRQRGVFKPTIGPAQQRTLLHTPERQRAASSRASLTGGLLRRTEASGGGIADHRTILTQTKKTATTKVKKTAKTRMKTLPLDDQLATRTDTINMPCGARSLTT